MAKGARGRGGQPPEARAPTRQSQRLGKKSGVDLSSNDNAAETGPSSVPPVNTGKSHSESSVCIATFKLNVTYPVGSHYQAATTCYATSEGRFGRPSYWS